MFLFFNRHAAANATCIEPAAMQGVLMQPVKASPSRETEATAIDADAEQPATYEELLPYLMLAMATAI